MCLILLKRGELLEGSYFEHDEKPFYYQINLQDFSDDSRVVVICIYFIKVISNYFINLRPALCTHFSFSLSSVKFSEIKIKVQLNIVYIKALA